jgi:sulfate adenylyltransferase subunit 2
MREVVAEAESRPVMLYSVGKDSAVMLHLARKAFYPRRRRSRCCTSIRRGSSRRCTSCATGWQPKAAWNCSSIRTPKAERGINPFDHGPLHTDMWKTEGLKQALDKYGFDAAFGGARRDEEKSRAKERIFSFRTASHGWDPKNQRPELWNLYNARKAKGESIRVFPISNWTELDIWQYIQLNDIPIVPLYFARRSARR